ncbi:MAG TPA: TonB-dependent receptor [Candidatus Goldiibacteriota bacterium]|nr:TonB-dependent receptor [Candidatus Goldiibacteriota bacterium]
MSYKMTAALLAVFVSAAAVIAADYDLGTISVDESGYSYGINDYGRSMSVFKSGAIAPGSSNVDSLLAEAPGLYFGKAGIIDSTVGSFGMSVFKIRGMGELPNSGILTLMDDRPLSMSVFRHQLLDTLALDAVDSVEITKGPSGVEHGNMATAGVISIRTKRMTEDGVKTAIKAAGGSHFTQDYTLLNMFKSGSLDYTLSAGFKTTQGARRNSDSYQQNYLLQTGYAYNKEIRFGVNAGYDDVLFYNPGPTYAVKWDREQEACQMRHFTGDVRVENTSDDFKGKIIAYMETGGNEFLKSTAPSGVTIPGTDIYYQNYGVRFMEEWNLIPGNVIKIGFDWQNFGGHFINYPLMPSMKRDVTASENDYAPYAVIAQKVGIVSVMFGARYGFNTKWGNEFVPQAGITLSAFEGNRIYLNVSKGYRTPAMGTVIFADYDGLNPESFWQYETGFTHDFGEMLSIVASVYQIECQNLLRDTDPLPLVTYLENTGFAVIRGAEAGVELNPAESFRLGAGLSYNEPGDASARTALFTGNIYAAYAVMKEFGVRLEAEFAKDRYDADKKKEKLGDYVCFNASANYDIKIEGVSASLFADFSNILDNKYEIKKGYPAAGFVAKGGVTLRF